MLFINSYLWFGIRLLVTQPDGVSIGTLCDLLRVNITDHTPRGYHVSPNHFYDVNALLKSLHPKVLLT